MNTATITEMNTPTNFASTLANTLVNQYFAIWNERDATQRRALIAQTWTDDASYLDPHMRGDGHLGIDTMVQAVQERFTGHHFRQINKIDTHNEHMRFSWELVPEGGVALAGGTDFATISSDGRLQSVIGFLDYVPAASA